MSGTFEGIINLSNMERENVDSFSMAYIPRFHQCLSPKKTFVLCKCSLCIFQYTNIKIYLLNNQIIIIFINYYFSVKNSLKYFKQK